MHGGGEDGAERVSSQSVAPMRGAGATPGMSNRHQQAATQAQALRQAKHVGLGCMSKWLQEVKHAACNSINLAQLPATVAKQVALPLTTQLPSQTSVIWLFQACTKTANLSTVSS